MAIGQPSFLTPSVESRANRKSNSSEPRASMFKLSATIRGKSFVSACTASTVVVNRVSPSRLSWVPRHPFCFCLFGILCCSPSSTTCLFLLLSHLVCFDCLRQSLTVWLGRHSSCFGMFNIHWIGVLGMSARLHRTFVWFGLFSIHVWFGFFGLVLDWPARHSCRFGCWASTPFCFGLS